tara:strand:+ start:386 stop:679 length:294 start_codon:yes stop_codon:yes gene_type:complete
MNEDEIMIKYSRGETIEEEELNFLENHLVILINEASLSDLRPAVANNDICDYLGLRHESFKMNCIASILDKIRPIENGMDREQKVFHVILQCRFLYY